MTETTVGLPRKCAGGSCGWPLTPCPASEGDVRCWPTRLVRAVVGTENNGGVGLCRVASRQATFRPIGPMRTEPTREPRRATERCPTSEALTPVRVGGTIGEVGRRAGRPPRARGIESPRGRRHLVTASRGRRGEWDLTASAWGADAPRRSPRRRRSSWRVISSRLARHAAGATSPRRPVAWPLGRHHRAGAERGGVDRGEAPEPSKRCGIRPTGFASSS